MKFPIALLAIATAVAGLSCAGTTTPPGQDRAGTLSAPEGATTSGVGAPSQSIEGDVPPQGARFHLFCDAITGQSHVIRATQLKAQLIQMTGLHGWHIVHTADQSMIYFGYYRAVSADDPTPNLPEVARAQADRRRIVELKNPQNDPLFRSPMFLPISDPDPVAPPEWNLVNVPYTNPDDAYWSLEVAAFRGSSERKQAAVDAVRKMRASGIEAYYFHGEQISSVCIGVFRKDAIKAQQSADGGNTRTPDEIPLVIPFVMPPNIDPHMKDREGNHLLVQAQKLEILDPKLAELAKDKYWKYHWLNGAVFGTKDKNGNLVPDPSFLVYIPHAANTARPLPGTGTTGDTTTANIGDHGAADAITGDISPRPATPQRPDRGLLRSIDGH